MDVLSPWALALASPITSRTADTCSREVRGEVRQVRGEVRQVREVRGEVREIREVREVREVRRRQLAERGRRYSKPS